MWFRVLLTLPYYTSGPDKVCNDCTLYFVPHKNASEKHFEEGRKICPAKGIDMIRKYGTVEV